MALQSFKTFRPLARFSRCCQSSPLGSSTASPVVLIRLWPANPRSGVAYPEPFGFERRMAAFATHSPPPMNHLFARQSGFDGLLGVRAAPWGHVRHSGVPEAPSRRRRPGIPTSWPVLGYSGAKRAPGCEEPLDMTLRSFPGVLSSRWLNHWRLSSHGDEPNR